MFTSNSSAAARQLVEEVVAAELGAPPVELFAEWDDRPLASASIGQVHRGRTADGRAVEAAAVFTDNKMTAAPVLTSDEHLRRTAGHAAAVIFVNDPYSVRKAGTDRQSSLEKANQQVVEAADGNQAIQHFQSGEFDLVLTDWNMPGKSGIEVIRAVRTVNRQIPIVMITTEAEKSRVLEAIQAGVTDYLVKPFTTDLLRQKLEKFAVPT